MSKDSSQGADAVRVLRVFSRLNVGGPSLHVVLLTAGLRQFGYETRLLVGHESPREGNLLDWARSKGVECEQVDGLGRSIRPLSDLRSLVALYRAMKGFRPAIVHTHTAKAGLLGRIAARLAGVPVVVHTFHGHVLRGYFGPVGNALFRALERQLARRTTRLVAVSEAVRDDLVGLRVASRERITVIPLGLELQRLTGELPHGRLRAQAGIPLDAPLVGCVGRLAPIKDLRTLLAAAAILFERHPEAHLALVGDGEERSLLQGVVLRAGWRDRVHFLGWQEDMATVYGDLDVVVNTSRNEGTPVALIEALAAGRPVVATAVGGTPEVLDGGRLGWLVPPQNPEALAVALGAALDARGSEAARARAEQGRASVLARHSSERLIADMDRLYRDLLAPVESAA